MPQQAAYIQPMGFNETQAAAYVGLGVTAFREMVENGAMPQPRKHGRRLIYVRTELDSHLIALPTVSEIAAEKKKSEWDNAQGAAICQ